MQQPIALVVDDERDIRELIEVRDYAYDVSRTAELLYQDAKNSMEIAVVRRAEEQARLGALRRRETVRNG